MKTTILLFCSLLLAGLLTAQTVIPNGGFEAWTSYGSYSNPDSWDTPNEELMSIPFFGTATVSKSTDMHGGAFSAKLESKHITLPPLDAPGFVITATLTLDIASMSFVISGGVPINDQPSHLTGFYKFLPKGGDSCIIGIGLFRTTAGLRDSIAHAEFSTKDTVTDWTPFSAWIAYDTVVNPDTMQVYALSSAQEIMTPGTVLYVDDIALDYITGFNAQDPGAGIRIYHDRESNRLMMFFDFPEYQEVSVHLFNMQGQEVRSLTPEPMQNGRQIIPVNGLPQGVYILEILHGDKKYTRKYFLKT
jgi:hypothetical protein